MNNITILGISILALYSLGQILSFVGIDQSIYGSYFLFYILLVISISVLPNDYPS
uniref:Uncharacterized protein n=1 Tax=viral metagenome TaxID=1070528 RepID=A0A6C0LNM1_9ZZZZ